MRTRKSAQDRKAEIELAALALAFEAGPDRVTTGMIADRLGLTQPAIYKHFPRKDDIWNAITKSLGAQVRANIADATARAATPVARLRLLVLGHLRLVHRTPALPQIMVTRDPNGQQSAARAEIQSAMTEYFQALTSAIVDGQGNASLRAETNAKDLATLVFGIIQSLVLRMLVTRDPAVLLEDSERLLDLQLSAFARQGGGK